MLWQTKYIGHLEHVIMVRAIDNANNFLEKEAFQWKFSTRDWTLIGRECSSTKYRNRLCLRALPDLQFYLMAQCLQEAKPCLPVYL